MTSKRDDSRRYVALGKLSGLWHVVAGSEEEGRRLIPLSPRRRRAFTAAELAHAERFVSLQQARGVGRLCGFERTYASPEPRDVVPEPDAFGERRIVRDLLPSDAAEAERLDSFISAHAADHAALRGLSLEQLIRGSMLRQMRSRDSLQRSTGAVTAAELAVTRPTRRAFPRPVPDTPFDRLLQAIAHVDGFVPDARAIFDSLAKARLPYRAPESITLGELQELVHRAAREHAEKLSQTLFRE